MYSPLLLPFALRGRGGGPQRERRCRATPSAPSLSARMGCKEGGDPIRAWIGKGARTGARGGAARMRAGTQAAWHPSPFACRICHANGIHAGMLPPHPFALLTCACNGIAQNPGQHANWGPQWEAPHIGSLTPPIRPSSRRALSPLEPVIIDRSSSAAVFQNWGRTFTCTPSSVFCPENESQLELILELVRHEGQTIRAVDVGRSPRCMSR